ncbi:hypothetical protein [Geotalea sp. SG265]|uniref:hypothetical protein n=1 Tax=Geotalea sp. SG265 TaxID=2922867 RepID=UPI001FB0004F|nr:hypothetical protein [Geotalea sp. SG265]
MNCRIPCFCGAMPRLFITLFLLTFLSACAAAPQTTTIFFPPAPDAPHVQYLTSISTVRDIRSSLFAGEPGPGEKIAKPYGIAVTAGKIYISDVPFARVSIVDLVEKEFKQLPQGILKTPINIAFDEKGAVYVADPGTKGIVRFTYDDQITHFPTGEIKPTDMAARGKELYVVDYRSSSIKIFDIESGTLLDTLGRDSSKGEVLSLPTNMAIDKEGNIYVTNLGTCRVIKMDRSGKLLKAFGELGDRPGQFTRPKGIAVDDNGLIYVVDAGSQVVQIFDQNGQVLMFFGEQGSKGGTLNIPADIAVTRENLDYFRKFADPSFEVEHLIFVTNQSGPRKISVYGFGHTKPIIAANKTAQK